MKPAVPDASAVATQLAHDNPSGQVRAPGATLVRAPVAVAAARGGEGDGLGVARAARAGEGGAVAVAHAVSSTSRQHSAMRGIGKPSPQISRSSPHLNTHDPALTNDLAYSWLFGRHGPNYGTLGWHSEGRPLPDRLMTSGDARWDNRGMASTTPERYP
jgi:hypothetical protein